MKKYVYILLDEEGKPVGLYTSEPVAKKIAERAESEGKKLEIERMLIDAPYEYLKL